MTTGLQALFFTGTLWGSEIHIWRAGIPDVCEILAYWYGREHSISHSPFSKKKEQKKKIQLNASPSSSLKLYWEDALSHFTYEETKVWQA